MGRRRSVVLTSWNRDPIHRRGGDPNAGYPIPGGCGTQLVEINTDGSDETAITQPTNVIDNGCADDGYHGFRRRRRRSGPMVRRSPTAPTRTGGDSSGNTYTNIFLINSDGTDLHQLTSDEYDDYPAWSLDGSDVAFINAYSVNEMAGDGSGGETVLGGSADAWVFDFSFGPAGASQNPYLATEFEPMLNFDSSGNGPR